VRAYYNRGNAWTYKKEYDKAIADFNEAIRIDPKYACAYHNRGNAWGNKKDYEKAIADYSEAMRIDPKCAYAYNGRGNAWRANKDYDKALSDYNEGIGIDPKYARPHFNRAVTYLVSRQDGATDGMKRVLELEDGKGERSTCAVILGSLAARIGKDDGLAKEFLGPLAAKLDAAQWPYPVVRYLRAELDDPGLLALAIDDDKRTQAHCYVGLDLLAKGQFERAFQHLRWVKEHGTPSLVEYTIALAELDRAGFSDAVKREGTIMRQAGRPASPAPATKPDDPAKVAKLVGTVLYVPTPDLE